MANTRITQGVIKPNEDYDVRHINATGIITATNLNLSGVLTYEDVTNVDSIGIITARDGIVSLGVVTATAFHGDGSNLTGVDSTALKDPAGNVKVQAQASGAVHTGISTFDTINVGSGVTIESNGQATFVGVVTFGSNSTTIGDNVINVGTALTLGHTQGVQFHTQNLHADGFEINNINASGIITAAQFSGDGSNLANLPAGLGTALSSTQSSPLNKIYYTNTVLPIESTVTVDTPASASAAYTQYAEISLGTGADLIISDGDDLIPDVLGLRPDGTIGGGALGRMRVDKLVGKDTTSAVNVEKGLVVTGVVTATSFNGSLAASNLTGALPAIDGSNLTGISGVTINSNADNRIITGSGTAATLNAESGLTYDGSAFTLSSGRLNLTDESSGQQLSIGASGDFMIEHDSNHTYLGNTTGDIVIQNDASVKITAKSGGIERFRFDSTGLSFDADTDSYISRPSADKISITTGGSERFSVANTRIDAKEPLYLETAGSYIKSNQLLFNPSGAAYIDHGVTGQSINFRMSSSSALDTTAMTINHNGHITRPANPCASMNVSSSLLSGNYMSHNSVHTNIGNHYNTGTSIFTCPVAGLYYVSIMVMSNNSNQTMDLEFHINGSNSNNILVPYQEATGGSYNQVSGSAIVYCPANAELRFKLNSGSIYAGRHSNITFALFA